MTSYAGYLLETFVTLLVVCGLAFVVLYGARRLGLGRPRGPIRLVGQLPLDARRAIYLVEVGGQVIVVGASEAGLTRIGEVAATELPGAERERAGAGASAGARAGAGGAAFGEVLARVLGGRKASEEATEDKAP